VYVSAWLKCHHPAAFCCALLNAQPMGFYQPSQLVQDARRHGVRVLPVDVRHSDWDCSLEAGRDGAPQLRLGLRLVKGLGETAGQRIEQARRTSPFVSLRDLAERAELKKRDLDVLAEAAALRGIAGHRHRARWEAAAVSRSASDLLHGVGDGDAIDSRATALRPPGVADELRADYATTGLTLGPHPIALLRSVLRKRRALPAKQLLEKPHGTRVRACGLVTMRQRPMTANGTIFLTLEDESGCVNVVLWPRVWERQRAVMLHARVLAVDGVLESDGDVHHLIAERLHDFSQLASGLQAPSRDFH
jgi:error-prone DNA polymerase